MNCDRVGEGLIGVVKASERTIGLSQVPKHAGIPRIEFSRSFEIGNRFIPATLTSIDRTCPIPDLGIVWRGLLRDFQFCPSQFVIAVAVVIIIAEGKASITQIWLQL